MFATEEGVPDSFEVTFREDPSLLKKKQFVSIWFKISETEKECPKNIQQ